MVPPANKILRKVKHTIKEYDLIQQGEKIIVAVSGGADSVCLLHILNSFKKDFNLSIHVAHLNHLLRGKESDRDEDFVRKSAESLSLPCTIEKSDIKALKKKLKTSTQAAARIARIDFLSRLKNKINASKIALGHTLDDRVETVFINLIKGSGTSGIAGMDFFNKNLSIIRPLMNITRNEVETYLDLKKIKFVTDSSNFKNIYLRNKIRIELIPLLENSFNPEIKKRIADTAQILSVEDKHLESLAKESLKFILTKTSHKPLPANDSNGQDLKKIVLNIILLKDLPVPIIYRIIRNVFWRLSSKNKKLTFSHVEKIYSSIKQSQTGKTISLPENIKVQKNYNELIFFKPSKINNFHFFKEIKLQVPGQTKLPYQNKILNSFIIPKNSIKFIVKDKNLGLFDFQKIKLPLTIRSKRDGDSFTPLGMNKQKKLKNFFIDIKVPQLRRKEIPLLVSGEEIIWIAGERISDKFKVTTSTKDVLLIGIA